MKKILAGMLVASVFCGCDKDKDEENGLNLEGAWQKDCKAEYGDNDTIENHSKMRLEFNGGTLSVIQNQHGPSDTNCETIGVETVFTGNYVTGADADHETAVEGATALDLTMTSVRITPKTAEGVQFLNSATFCDKSDWTLDQAYEYTTEDGCSDLANQQPPAPGKKWHQIFRADPENVYFGDADQTNDGSTAEKAPIRLETEPFTRA